MSPEVVARLYDLYDGPSASGGAQVLKLDAEQLLDAQLETATAAADCVLSQPAPSPA